MPEIPELEGPAPWASVAVDFVWAAHHSLIIENVSDFSHAHLHRKYRPFNDAKLTDLETSGTQVRLSYDVLVGDGRFSKHFVDRSRVKVDRMDLCFDYPYQWSDTGGRIKHWCFLLPLDLRTTHVFFLFYFDAVQMPLLRRPMPRGLQRLLMLAARRLLIRPLLAQDGRMVEAEQQAYERDPYVAGYELNPAVAEFQKLIVGQWRVGICAAPGGTAVRETSLKRSSEAASPLVTGGGRPSGGEPGAATDRRRATGARAAAFRKRACERGRPADIEVLVGDLRDRSTAAAAVQGCRQVYHCAARVSTMPRRQAELFDCNVLGTRWLLQAARAAGRREGCRHQFVQRGRPSHRRHAQRRDRTVQPAGTPSALRADQGRRRA